MTTEQNINDAMTAHQAGASCAASLKEGDVFMGAMPSADKVYARDSLNWRMFCSGYVANLPRNIYTNSEGAIVSIGN